MKIEEIRVRKLDAESCISHNFLKTGMPSQWNVLRLLISFVSQDKTMQEYVLLHQNVTCQQIMLKQKDRRRWLKETFFRDVCVLYMCGMNWRSQYMNFIRNVGEELTHADGPKQSMNHVLLSFCAWHNMIKTGTR